MNNCRRTATVVSKDPVQLVVISKEVSGLFCQVFQNLFFSSLKFHFIVLIE